MSEELEQVEAQNEVAPPAEQTNEESISVNDLLVMSEEIEELSKSIVFQDNQLEAMTNKMAKIIKMQSLFIQNHTQHIVFNHSDLIAKGIDIDSLKAEIAKLKKAEKATSKAKKVS